MTDISVKELLQNNLSYISMIETGIVRSRRMNLNALILMFISNTRDLKLT